MFERLQIYDSYACRKGKGTNAALVRALHFTKRYPYFLKLDMKKYFDSIPHKKLAAFYCVMEGRGLPIGNLTSQYFANFYLRAFDRYAKERLKVKAYIRYMDDILLFAQSIQEIKELCSAARRFLENELLLTLKEETCGKTAGGVPFLGFLLKPKGIYLSQKKKKRLKKRIKQYCYKLESGVWDEEEYALHITPVLAHVAISRCRKYCNRILQQGKKQRVVS